MGVGFAGEFLTHKSNMELLTTRKCVVIRIGCSMNDIERLGGFIARVGLRDGSMFGQLIGLQKDFVVSDEIPTPWYIVSGILREDAEKKPFDNHLPLRNPSEYEHIKEPEEIEPAWFMRRDELCQHCGSASHTTEDCEIQETIPVLQFAAVVIRVGIHSHIIPLNFAKYLSKLSWAYLGGSLERSNCQRGS